MFNNRHTIYAAATMFVCCVASPRLIDGQIPIFSSRPTHVVNMIPLAMSGESSQDAEPTIAVDPANTNSIVASAFISPSGVCATGGNSAPLLVSSDGGTTWTASCIVPSDGAGLGTRDISVKFGTAGGNLYAGILRRPDTRFHMLRTNSPLGPGLMTSIQNRANIDQPFLNVMSTTVAGSINDRPHVGLNDFAGSNGATATSDVSTDASVAAAAFISDRLETRTTWGQDLPSIRASINPSGRVYAAFLRLTAFDGAQSTADVVVVRDDSWGTGTGAFAALQEPNTPPGDGGIGIRVARGVTIAWGENPGLGQSRIGSDLAISASPINPDVVYVAWADGGNATAYTLHLRRSTNGGAAWSNDLRAISNAKNPAIAIGKSGEIAFLYQQVRGSGTTARWETKVELSSNVFSTYQTKTLATVPANTPVFQYQPYLGDYADMVAVGDRFYGVFSANNSPDAANFPSGVTYQRNADFQGHILRATNGVTAVTASIDPFFFEIGPPFWRTKCWFQPNSCGEALVKPGVVVLKCLIERCAIRDLIPKNCLVKYVCPGCPEGGLCPPEYNFRFEGLENAWDVSLLDGEGNPVEHDFRRDRAGVTLTFRPDKQHFKPGEVGDYQFIFEMTPDGKVGREYKVRAAVQVGNKTPRDGGLK